VNYVLIQSRSKVLAHAFAGIATERGHLAGARSKGVPILLTATVLSTRHLSKSLKSDQAPPATWILLQIFVMMFFVISIIFVSSAFLQNAHDTTYSLKQTQQTGHHTDNMRRWKLCLSQDPKRRTRCWTPSFREREASTGSSPRITSHVFWSPGTFDKHILHASDNSRNLISVRMCTHSTYPRVFVVFRA
jgi:hypothetical protein